MHRSRIGVVLIDLPEEHYDEASSFWGAALGETLVPEDETPPVYATCGRIGSANLELQRTGSGTPARVHLDIETDDVRAEVGRLVDLGATITDERDGYTILADPGGLVFCVVPVQTGADFEASATRWH